MSSDRPHTSSATHPMYRQIQMEIVVVDAECGGVLCRGEVLFGAPENGPYPGDAGKRGSRHAPHEIVDRQRVVQVSPELCCRSSQMSTDLS